MLCTNKIKKTLTNIEFCIIYNDPKIYINPKLHVFRAICISKPEMKNMSYPVSMGRISEDNNLQTPYFKYIQFYVILCTNFMLVEYVL